MNECTYCKKELPNIDAAFCVHCGMPLTDENYEEPTVIDNSPRNISKKNLLIITLILLIVASILYMYEEDQGQEKLSTQLRQRVDNQEKQMQENRIYDQLQKGIENFNKSVFTAFLNANKDIKAYASVGFAEDYPDQVLITISYPGTMWVQFLSDPLSGKVSMLGRGQSDNVLPASVKDWNATVQNKKIVYNSA